MDAELMDRLQAVAKNEKVGFSRVAENCIRGYLPVYEFIDRLRQEKSIAEFGKTNPIPFVHPDILGRAMVYGLKKILKDTKIKEGLNSGKQN
jgi:hypothetical protein